MYMYVRVRAHVFFFRFFFHVIDALKPGKVVHKSNTCSQSAKVQITLTKTSGDSIQLNI